MRRITACGLVMVLILAAACGPPSVTAPTATCTPRPVRPDKLRIEIPADADIADIPRLMAVESLREQGYAVETLSLAETSLTLLAMEKGDLDLATADNSQTWTAITHGAPIMTILDDKVNTFLVAATERIKECADLKGKRVGVSGMKATATVLLSRYIERHCPGVLPEYLIISGSNNRWAGLLADHLDAAVVDLSDTILLAGVPHSGIHVLVAFSQEYSDLRTAGIVIRRSLAQQYPETVKDIVRALLLARRSIQDPAVLSAELVKRMQMDPGTARTAAETYLARKVWDVNGGLTPATVQANIDFLVEVGSLEPGLGPDDVADLSYLNAVLDEIGRR